MKELILAILINFILISLFKIRFDFDWATWLITLVMVFIDLMIIEWR